LLPKYENKHKFIHTRCANSGVVGAGAQEKKKRGGEDERGNVEPLGRDRLIFFHQQNYSTRAITAYKTFLNREILLQFLIKQTPKRSILKNLFYRT
jgi:hypothetical protein